MGCRERSFKKRHESDEEKEGRGSCCSNTAFHEEHVDEADEVHDQEDYPVGVLK